jgi:phosphotransferase system enzyme I (PtsI)
MVLADVMEDLDERGVPFNRDMPIGMMVEVPAAVIMLDHFVKEVDFLSIGTNDLVQYTLAVDRSNKDVVQLYNPADPAVLRLIKTSLDIAARENVPINMCGQMSGAAIPEIKNLMRNVTIEQCQAVSAHAMRMENAREIKSYLMEEMKKRLPGSAG